MNSSEDMNTWEDEWILKLSLPSVLGVTVEIYFILVSNQI